MLDFFFLQSLIVPCPDLMNYFEPVKRKINREKSIFVKSISFFGLFAVAPPPQKKRRNFIYADKIEIISGPLYWQAPKNHYTHYLGFFFFGCHDAYLG